LPYVPATQTRDRVAEWTEDPSRFGAVSDGELYVSKASLKFPVECVSEVGDSSFRVVTKGTASPCPKHQDLVPKMGADFQNAPNAASKQISR
jgi:hypothetical protein